MRRLILAAALAALVSSPAFAAPVALAPAQFSTEFQEKLTEELGEREAATLREMVASALTRELAGAGGEIAPAADVTIETLIVDARANRPTFQQLNDRTSLSYADSIGTGGAELEAVLRASDGRELSRVSHRYYETNLRFASLDQWGDARRAMRQFARKVAAAYRAADQ